MLLPALGSPMAKVVYCHKLIKGTVNHAKLNDILD